jgi:hypothetical protein
MALSLQHFEEQIDPTILKRGERLWQIGAVTSFDVTQGGRINARVEGTDDYEVTIQFQAEEVNDFNCTCPYDDGPVCKHVVAVLLAYTLPADEQLSAAPKKKPKAKKKTLKPQFKAVLKETSDDDLRAFVEGYAKSNQTFKNAFLSRFMKVDAVHGEEHYGVLIRSMVRFAEGRYGLIDYAHCRDLGQKMVQLVEKASNMKENDQNEKALQLVKAVIKEMTPVLAHADDSAGDIGDSIFLAFSVLEDVMVACKETEQRKSLLNYCVQSAEEARYRGSDSRTNFLEFAIDLAAEPDEVRALHEQLQKYGNSNDKSEYAYNYAMEMRLRLMQKSGDAETESQFIKEHIKLPKFREIAIKNARKLGNTGEAKQLALDGLKLNKDLAGVIKNWKIVLLELAREADDQKQVIELSKELFFTLRDSFKYYEILKDQFLPQEWQAQVDQIIEELDAKRRWPDHDRICDILLKEDRLEDLMAWLKKASASISMLERYQAHLLPEYSERVHDLYEQDIRKGLEQTGGRKAYQRSCKDMLKLKKLGGDAHVKRMADDFTHQYDKRIALMEELRKFFFV